MSHNNQLSTIYNRGELEEFYSELQTDILDIAYNKKGREVKKSDIWKIVIQEGLYQNLVENVSVAIEFLTTTSYGPGDDYKDYLDLANNHTDVVVLVALSALANDTYNRRNNYVNDVIMPNQASSGDALGDVADLPYENKTERASTLLPSTDCAVSEEELVLSGELYDYPLIDYLDDYETLKFLFKSSYQGYSTAKLEGSVDPSDDAHSYTIITNKRVLVIVGKEHLSDQVLSIPILSIKDIKIKTGWTKDKIQVNTKNGDNGDPYYIWVPNINKYYDESDIVDHILGQTTQSSS